MKQNLYNSPVSLDYKTAKVKFKCPYCGKEHIAETESSTTTEYDGLGSAPYDTCIVSDFNYECPETRKVIGIQVKDVEINITDYRLIDENNKEVKSFS